MATATQRARAAARTGYALSESVYVRDLFHVHKPDGTRYTVDAANPEHVTCTCLASVPCKHVGLVEISRRFWQAMERPAARPIRRRLFSARRLAAFRALAPTFAAPAKPVPPIDPDREARRARIAAMILADFGPAN